MSETAAAQLRRILHLVPQLADGEAHAIDELARRLGVTRQVLFRDLVSVSDRFDEPGGFVAGVTLEWDDRELSAHTSHFLRPMRLTMRELCALELGLALLKRERAPDEAATIDRALVRLRDAITHLPANELLQGVQHADADAAGHEHLPTIRKAIEASTKLRIAYRGGAASESATRVVSPYRVLFAQGQWYTVAWCDRSEGLRFFRLDRVESVEPTADGFTMPADFSVDALVADHKVFRAEDAEPMTVRYSPRIARWIAEREEKSLDADGSLTLEHPVADVQWAVRHVLQYGRDAEVVAPERVRAAVRERLAGLAASIR